MLCTMSINEALQGIELTFNEKPGEEIREKMKLAGFRWHRMKQLWYAKNTPERMALAVEITGPVAPEPVPVPAPAATENSGPVSKYGIQVGDILEDSWGYEQTNVEFYLVTRIVSACKIEIVELGHTTVSTESSMSGYVMPDTECQIGEPVQKMVSQNSYERQSGSWHVKINDSVSLAKWDGQPCFQSSWY